MFSETFQVEAASSPQASRLLLSSFILNCSYFLLFILLIIFILFILVTCYTIHFSYFSLFMLLIFHLSYFLLFILFTYHTCHLSYFFIFILLTFHTFHTKLPAATPIFFHSKLFTWELKFARPPWKWNTVLVPTISRQLKPPWKIYMSWHFMLTFCDSVLANPWEISQQAWVVLSKVKVSPPWLPIPIHRFKPIPHFLYTFPKSNFFCIHYLTWVINDRNTMVS